MQEAKEDLDRVKLQGDRKLAQFTADVESQKKTLELSEAKLARDKKQLAATKIYAPQDGLVVYGSAEGGGHFSSESMIEEGAVVRNRQQLINLPDISEFKLKVKIHESHINQVQRGQPAFVVLDSMPDQRFRGVVNKVAPLPDTQSRWGNPDLKVYATEILLTEKIPDVKPGVSARAEIVITNLANVLTVPIQAVTTRKGKQVVFLASAPSEPVPVTVGMYNSKFIEITEGLKAGDRVMLSPPFDTKDKDMGGGIIAQGETPPEGATNLPPLNVENGNRARPGPPMMEGEGAPAGGGGRRQFNPDGARGGDTPPSEGMRSGKRGGPGGQPPGVNREEMMKRFDTNATANWMRANWLPCGNSLVAAEVAPTPQPRPRPTNALYARMKDVEPIIRLVGLEKRYDLGGEAEVLALRGVNLVVKPAPTSRSWGRPAQQSTCSI